MTTWSGHTVSKARAHWKARLPLPCHLCPGTVDGTRPWVVEHIVPRSLGGDTTDPSNQWVSHRTCSDKSGAKVRTARRRAAQPAPRRLEENPAPW